MKTFSMNWRFDSSINASTGNLLIRASWNPAFDIERIAIVEAATNDFEGIAKALSKLSELIGKQGADCSTTTEWYTTQGAGE